MTDNELEALIERAKREGWTELDLSNQWLYTLPPLISQLTNLKALNLSHNALAHLPSWLGQLTNLQSLDLSSNILNCLPDWLGQLANLQSLNLSCNGFTGATEWLGRQTYKTLLSHNTLIRFSEWLGQLTNLQTLNLSHNRLASLPKSLGQLTNLRTLDISCNKFTHLPEAIVRLPQLEALYIHHNPFIEPSPEVLEGALTHYNKVDLEALRRYYTQLREEGTAVFYEAKLLIIGEGGVGKTSLARKLESPNAPLAIDEASTEGIDIIRWPFDLPDKIGQEQYHVNIWDFGGQEIYFATHQFFLTKRSVYILVTDTRRQDGDFYTWLRMQEAFGDDSPVILIKNRNRRHGNHFHIENLPQLQARFPNLAKRVFEIDLGDVPHDEMWPQLVRELKHRFLGLAHVGQPRPSTWVRVREALQEDERETISREAYSFATGRGSSGRRMSCN